MDADDLRVLFLLIVYWNLKPLFIMAKFELKFIDCFVDEDFIKVEKRTHSTTNLDYILISTFLDNDEIPHQIMMDKSTAIKFAKTLRTEINKITESEGGCNG